MVNFGILTQFAGVVSHDAYTSYDSKTLNTQATALADGADGAVGVEGYRHALCVAHARREILGVAEHDRTAAADRWAEELERLIDDLFRWRSHWASKGRSGLPANKVEIARRRWDELVYRALVAHPPQRGRKGGQSHARRLAVRLQARADDYLRWIEDFTILATNNNAERAVRMTRAKTKVSGGFGMMVRLQQLLSLRGFFRYAALVRGVVIWAARRAGRSGVDSCLT